MVITDSTFQITKSFKPAGKEQVRSEMYHFKQLSPNLYSKNTFPE